MGFLVHIGPPFFRMGVHSLNPWFDTRGEANQSQCKAMPVLNCRLNMSWRPSGQLESEWRILF